ncbi:hypothetical protein ACHAXS_009518 [Conticribra weissflogii]
MMPLLVSVFLLGLSKNSLAFAPGFVASPPRRTAECARAIFSTLSGMHLPLGSRETRRRDLAIFTSKDALEAWKDPTSPSPEASRRLVSLLNSADSDDGDESEALRTNRMRDAIASLEIDYANSNATATTAVTPHNEANDNNPVDRFAPLIGLYRVRQVLPIRRKSNVKSTGTKNENPVGGKWTRANGIAQRILRTRNTFQHILPVNSTGLSPSHAITTSQAVAEAINVVSLDALDGLLRVTVILRGDAVPLSEQELRERNANRTGSKMGKANGNGGDDETLAENNDDDDPVPLDPLSDRTVRAYFDPPRIFLGKRRWRPFKHDKRIDDNIHDGLEYEYLPLSVGPPSDVILDTSYCDDSLRIGVGGTSGTRFVFTRCGTVEDVGDTAMESAAMDGVAASEIADERGAVIYDESDLDRSEQIEAEAKEYQILLRQPPAKKASVLTGLGAILAISLCIASGSGADIASGVWTTFQKGAILILAKLGIHAHGFGGGGAEALTAKVSFLSATLSKVNSPSQIVPVVGRWMGIGVRVLAWVASVMASVLMGLISFSSGGIERDRNATSSSLS